MYILKDKDNNSIFESEDINELLEILEEDYTIVDENNNIVDINEFLKEKEESNGVMEIEINEETKEVVSVNNEIEVPEAPAKKEEEKYIPSVEAPIVEKDIKNITHTAEDVIDIVNEIGVDPDYEELKPMIYAMKELHLNKTPYYKGQGIGYLGLLTGTYFIFDGINRNGYYNICKNVNDCSTGNLKKVTGMIKEEYVK